MNFIFSKFITAKAAIHHCTFSCTAHFVHHCTLKQALLQINPGQGRRERNHDVPPHLISWRRHWACSGAQPNQIR